MKIENVIAPTAAITVRREIKAMAQADSHLPVIVRPGNSGPHVTGQSLPRGYYTRAGDPIDHPSAYSKRGFSNMVYCCDRRQVIVGQQWLRRFAGNANFICQE